MTAAVALVFAIAAAAAATSSDEDAPTSYAATLVRVMEHPDQPFTEGLEFSPDESYLLETSGRYPAGVQSYIRRVDPQTGRTVGDRFTPTLPADAAGDGYFAEGIATLNGSWYTSTYDSKKAAEYDAELGFVRWHPYPWQGWGLAPRSDGAAFFATNGSEYIMELDKENFEPVASAKRATCLGHSVPGLNELEMVPNFMGGGKDVLFGNVYMTRFVMGLDPQTAKCVAVFDLSSFGTVEADESQGFHVANGIAYRPSNGNFVVTGKNWDNMFEVSIAEDPLAGAVGQLQEKLSSLSLLQEKGRLSRVSGRRLATSRLLRRKS